MENYTHYEGEEPVATPSKEGAIIELNEASEEEINANQIPDLPERPIKK